MHGAPFYLKEWAESVSKHVKGIKNKVGWQFVKQEISLKGSLAKCKSAVIMEAPGLWRRSDIRL